MSRVEQRKRWKESVRMLKMRLQALEAKRVEEIDRPMHEVAIKDLRAQLTELGRQLKNSE